MKKNDIRNSLFPIQNGINEKFNDIFNDMIKEQNTMPVVC